ncbi:NACHT domain-containing protein [Actinoplanes sp. NPDC051861]|uniref:NACHT domain-containing protein n=1 Tax=Actinoplanes sp. NPDC051861 TaxID=3155170 RepID=UPI003423D855
MNPTPLRTVAAEVHRTLRPPSLSLPSVRLLDRTSEQVVAVTGPAGAGKTTTLQTLAARICEDALNHRAPNRIAVYVDLATMAPAGIPTADQIREHVLDAVAGARAKLETVLGGETSCLFLFDSIDEMSVAWPPGHVVGNLRRLVEEIRRFLSPGGPRFRAVIAVRDTFPMPPEVPATAVAPLSYRQQRRLVTTLAHRRALRHLRAGAPDVAARPLSLRLWQENMDRRPVAPVEMYDLLGTTVAARLGSVVPVPRTSRKVQAIAAEVAAVLTRWQGPAIRTPRADVMAIVCRSTSFTEKEVADTVRCLENANLVVAARPRSISFAHRSFRDFFAARWLATNHPGLELSPYLTDLRWRDAMLLALRASPGR